MKIIEFREGRCKLPGHADTYDAVGYNEDLEEIGFYLNRDGQSYWSCRGMVIDRGNPFDI